jgi:hypothetical protein
LAFGRPAASRRKFLVSASPVGCNKSIDSISGCLYDRQGLAGPIQQRDGGGLERLVGFWAGLRACSWFGAILHGPGNGLKRSICNKLVE